jgi:hypothetical protein
MRLPEWIVHQCSQVPFQRFVRSYGMARLDEGGRKKCQVVDDEGEMGLSGRQEVLMLMVAYRSSQEKCDLLKTHSTNDV